MTATASEIGASSTRCSLRGRSGETRETVDKTRKHDDEGADEAVEAGIFRILQHIKKKKKHCGNI